MKGKKCPILSVWPEYTECLGDDCAWWDSNVERCVIFRVIMRCGI